MSEVPLLGPAGGRLRLPATGGIGVQGLLDIKYTRLLLGGPMLLGLALLKDPTAVCIPNFE